MSTIGEALRSQKKTGTVEKLGDGLAQFHGFCNVGFAWGGGAALVVDTSNAFLGEKAAAALAAATDDPARYLVYTHGHVDHVGGAPSFLQSARERGHPPPTVWAHENVAARVARYRLTWGWNNEVNRRQFQLPPGVDAFPREFVEADETYFDTAELDLAGERVVLHHARAETDDATWVWLPERAVAMVGDLSIGSIPNTGNPNKPQRYTLGWAEALEAIAARAPEILLPGHGGPIIGKDRIAEVLGDTARALRFLHDAVIERMNAGCWPDEIVDSGIGLPDDLAAKPHLAPLYGCAAFVVRDVLRQYAGWWGGNPAELLPARRAEIARDLVETAGRDALLGRVRELLGDAEPRRALHLVMHLVDADAGDRDAQALLADTCDALVATEPSFIARNFYQATASRARAAATE